MLKVICTGVDFGSRNETNVLCKMFEVLNGMAHFLLQPIAFAAPIPDVYVWF